MEISIKKLKKPPFKGFRKRLAELPAGADECICIPNITEKRRLSIANTLTHMKKHGYEFTTSCIKSDMHIWRVK